MSRTAPPCGRWRQQGPDRAEKSRGTCAFARVERAAGGAAGGYRWRASYQCGGLLHPRDHAGTAENAHAAKLAAGRWIGCRGDTRVSEVSTPRWIEAVSRTIEARDREHLATQALRVLAADPVASVRVENKTWAEIERDVLATLVKAHGGDVRRTARAVGVPQATFFDRLRRTGAHIPKPKPAKPEGVRSLNEIERDILATVLAQHGGDVAAAARTLDVPRATLGDRLRRAAIAVRGGGRPKKSR